MPSQILLVIDLDQTLSRKIGSDIHSNPDCPNDQDRQLVRLKHVILRQLANHCKLSNLKPDVSLFSYRFYSSSGYFGTSFDELSQSKKFEGLSRESWEKFENELDEKFENDNSSKRGSEIQKYLEKKNRKPEAFHLIKALNEIAIIYDWDSPFLNSPVKRNNKMANPNANSNGSENNIFVFSKFPSDWRQLNNFFQPGSESTKHWKHRDLFKELLGKPNAKNVLNLLKGEYEISLSLIDTSCLYQEPNFHVGVKEILKTALSNGLRNSHFWSLNELDHCPGIKNHFEEWYLPKSNEFKAVLTEIKNQDRENDKRVAKTLRDLQYMYQPKLTEPSASLASSSKASFVPRPNSISTCSDRSRQQRNGHFPRHPSSENLKRKLSSVDQHQQQHRPKPAKIPRKGSDESIASSSHSQQSNNNSRGVKILRLSNKRSSKDEKELNASNREIGGDGDKVQGKNQFKFEMATGHFIDEPDPEKLIQSLMKLQMEAIEDHNDSEDQYLGSLAAWTIQALLRHLQINKELKTVIEDLVWTNFLVSTDTIALRRTSQKIECRINDHKLQVFYGIEIHWLLPSQEKAKELEKMILTHLRQISIWNSPAELLRFLQFSVCATYSQRQPELLCILYEELSLQKPKEYLQLFSPFKDTAASPSVSHSSVVSHMSDGSDVQPRINKKDNFARSGNDPGFLVNLAKSGHSTLDKIEKLNRRVQRFDQTNPRKLLQINMNKTKKDKVRPLTASRMKLSRLARKAKSARKNSIKKKSSKESVSKNTKGVAGGNGASIHGQRAKRNLCFDIATRKSPRKKVVHATPKKININNTPQKKKTPKRLTPNKVHEVLAPETPNHAGGRRKSDGTVNVSETPDFAGQKNAAATPRTMKVRDTVRRKTFYEGQKVSRNILKSEENIQANFFNRSTSLLQDPACASSTSPSKKTRRSAQHLFPHLVKSSEPDEGDKNNSNNIIQTTFSTPKKTSGRHANLREESAETEATFFSPGRKVSFNMTRQKPTPKSSGKKAKGILKTPVKLTNCHKFKASLLFASPQKKLADEIRSPSKRQNAGDEEETLNATSIRRSPRKNFNEIISEVEISPPVEELVKVSIEGQSPTKNQRSVESGARRSPRKKVTNSSETAKEFDRLIEAGHMEELSKKSTKMEERRKSPRKYFDMVLDEKDVDEILKEADDDKSCCSSDKKSVRGVQIDEEVHFAMSPLEQFQKDEEDDDDDGETLNRSVQESVTEVLEKSLEKSNSSTPRSNTSPEIVETNPKMRRARSIPSATSKEEFVENVITTPEKRGEEEKNLTTNPKKRRASSFKQLTARSIPSATSKDDFVENVVTTPEKRKEKEENLTPSRTTREGRKHVLRYGIDDIDFKTLVSPDRRGGDNNRSISRTNERTNQTEETSFETPLKNIEKISDSSTGPEELTPRRASRNRSLVNRFGIDDTKLGDYVSPNNKKKRPLNNSASPSTFPLDSLIVPRIKRLKNSLNKEQQNEDKSLKLTIVQDQDCSSIADQNTSTTSSSICTSSQNASIVSQKQNTCNNLLLTEKRTEFDTPSKTWTVGNFKEGVSLTLKKSDSPSTSSHKVISNRTVQRISRRASKDVGMSPETLRRCLISSPSPKNKENVFKGKLDKPGMKYSPVTSSMSIYNLSTSPLVEKLDDTTISNSRKRSSKKVSKQLYIE